MKLWKNMRYILKYLFKGSPFYVVFMSVKSGLLVVLKIMELYVSKLIIDSLTDTTYDFFQLAVFYGVYILIDYLLSQFRLFIDNRIISIKEIEISKHMRSILFDKVKELDLSCYENSDFYNDYERAVNEIDTRPTKIVKSLANLMYYFLTFVFLTVLNVDLFFLFLLALGVAQYIFYLNDLNKLNFKMNQEATKPERKFNYIKDLFKNEHFIRESRTLQYADYFIRWNEDVMNERQDVDRKYFKKGIAKSVLTTFTSAACSIAVMIYLCMNMAQHIYSPGDFVYLINVFGVSTNLLIDLFRVIPDIRQHSLYVDNIRKILDLSLCD